MAYKAEIKQIETGADWLTMSTTSASKGDIYWKAFEAFCDGKCKDWLFHGYVGKQAVNGCVSWGQNKTDGRTLFIARGWVADEIFTRRPPSPSQISRLDIQTTIVYDRPQPELLESVYQEAGGLARNKSRVENNKGGETIYVGSRQSETFIRIYDAGVKHKLGEPACTFRYEIEVKKPLALALARLIWDQETVPKMREVMAEWQTGVLDKRSVKIPWGDGDVSLRFESLAQRKKMEDTTFTWLSQQVAVAIEKMLARGYTREELMAVLFPPVRTDPEY